LYRAGNDESAQAGALSFLPGRRAIERGNLSAFTSTCSTIVSWGLSPPRSATRRLAVRLRGVHGPEVAATSARC